MQYASPIEKPAHVKGQELQLELSNFENTHSTNNFGEDLQLSLRQAFKKDGRVGTGSPTPSSLLAINFLRLMRHPQEEPPRNILSNPSHFSCSERFLQVDPQ